MMLTTSALKRSSACTKQSGGQLDWEAAKPARSAFWFTFNAACLCLRPASAGPGSQVARGYRAVCWCQLLAVLNFVRIRWGGLLLSEETDQQFTKHWLTPANLIIRAPMMSASRRLRSARAAICLRRDLEEAELLWMMELKIGISKADGTTRRVISLSSVPFMDHLKENFYYC